jgi:methionine-rich copper-binding protein CopC
MSHTSHLLVTIAAAAIVSTAASAHPKLLTAAPAPSASVATPTSIELDFNEAVVARFSGVAVQMTDMPGMKMSAPMNIAVAPAVVDAGGKRLTAKLATPLAKGAYKVVWHAVAADTHRVAGSYSFTVK